MYYKVTFIPQDAVELPNLGTYGEVFPDEKFFTSTPWYKATFKMPRLFTQIQGYMHIRRIKYFNATLLATPHHWPV